MPISDFSFFSEFLGLQPRPSRFPHFFPFHVSSLNPAQASFQIFPPLSLLGGGGALPVSLMETWKGKKRGNNWLGYLSVHDGNLERREMLEKLAGLSYTFSPAQAVFHISFLSMFPASAQPMPFSTFLFFPCFHPQPAPRHFPHFFSFHVSILRLSSAQAIFHISFLSLLPAGGGGGGQFPLRRRGKERNVGDWAGLPSLS